MRFHFCDGSSALLLRIRGNRGGLESASISFVQCKYGLQSSTKPKMIAAQAAERREASQVGMRRLVAALASRLGSLAVMSPPAQQVQLLSLRRHFCSNSRRADTNILQKL